MENAIEQGEIYFVHLDPAFGREIGGYKLRPAVVVSINDIHQRTRIVAVVPATTKDPGRSYPNVVRVEVDRNNGLTEATFFQCHQVRAIDQGRMTARSTGRLSRSDFKKIETALSHCFGLLSR